MTILPLAHNRFTHYSEASENSNSDYPIFYCEAPHSSNYLNYLPLIHTNCGTCYIKVLEDSNSDYLIFYCETPHSSNYLNHLLFTHANCGTCYIEVLGDSNLN